MAEEWEPYFNPPGCPYDLSPVDVDQSGLCRRIEEGEEPVVGRYYYDDDNGTWFRYVGKLHSDMLLFWNPDKRGGGPWETWRVSVSNFIPRRFSTLA